MRVNRDQRRGRGAALTALVAAAAILLAACGIDANSVPSANATGTPTQQGNKAKPQIDIPVTASSTTAPPPISPDDLFAVAANVQAFWAKELPAVYGVAYKPLPPARIIAGTPDSDYPVCEGKRLAFDDVEGNAFAAPCPEGLTVVWDADKLLPSINEKYGPVAAAIVLAHEWGHIAQFETKVDADTVILEQQADCFAGTWLHQLIDDPGALGSLAKANPLDSAVSSIIEFRDAPGSSPNDPGAHGTGFDRVRALQEGYDRGGDYCKDYVTKPLPLVQLDLPNDGSSGNLPLDELVPLVVDDLNAFYNQIIDNFRGASADAVFADTAAKATLEDLSDRIGDNAAGVVLGMIWAGFAQQQVPSDGGRDKVGLLQQQACMAGGWLANVYNDTSEQRDLSLTAGDLDEAILGLIDLGGQSGKAQDTDGSVFRLIASLRQGVVDGFDSCKLGS